MTDNKILLKGRLNGRQRNRLKDLLDMPYTPKELAEEVGFNQDQIYMVYLKMGCPHERRANHHIWINGKDFRDWYIETYKKPERAKGEIYCISCKGYYHMKKVESKIAENGSPYDLYECPNCGNVNGRFLPKNEGKE